MFRKIAFSTVAGLCVLVACGDDEGDDFSGTGGQAGAAGAGRSGASGTSPGGTSGRPSSGGSAPVAGSVGEGGMSALPEAGSGGTVDMAGSGGTATAGQGGEPPGSEAGSGGTPMTEGGTGGLGATGGDDGSAGDGGSGGEMSGPIGLIAHYAFDEDTGTTSVDSTGRFGVATLAGDAEFGDGRGDGSGVELSAASAHVVLPPLLFAGVEKTTIAAWVRMTEYNPWSRVFDIPGTNGGIFLASDRGLGATDGLWFALPYSGTDGRVLTETDLPLDVWKHVAVTIDGPTYSIFVDGYPTATAQTNAWRPAQIEPTSAGYLGRSGVATDPYFKGNLDDFRIYDVVLSQSAIADLASPGEDYSYFRFDEPSGTTAADSSARDFDGTLEEEGVGETDAVFAAGRLGNALALDSTHSQYVSLPTEVISDCNDLTIALWANLSSVGNWTRLFDYFGDDGQFLYFTPAFPGTGQQLRFTIVDGPDQSVIGTYPDGTTLTGAWHHYAFTLSDTEGRVYFDGVEIGSNPSMTFDPADLDVGANPHAWLGRSHFPADPYLDGLVDDLRISCRAFTADEIKALAR